MGTSRHISVQRGFTLIELMIVIVIVAVLMAVALPAYQNSVIKANRGAAQSYLMEIAQKQQLFFNDTRTYAADPNALNLNEPPRVSASYDVSITLGDPNDPPAFTVTAAPLAGTRQVQDGSLTIDNTGEKLRGTKPW